MTLKIIGGGLAGCEAAWQLAKRNIEVDLYEMKPKKHSPAHSLDTLGELVCSNSLRSNQVFNAVGLLKEELSVFGFDNISYSHIFVPHLSTVEQPCFLQGKLVVEKLIENIKRLVSFNNMHIHIDLIAGLTGEDLKSFERSFNIGYSLKAHMLQMGFLKLLYGADMRENREKYPCEFNENPPYEVTSTPWLSKVEIVKLKKCEDALERMYNSGRFLFTLEYLLNECGYTPFKLFMDFGNEIDGNKMSLSDYAIHIYYFFKEFTDEEILRETILCDLLSCSSSVQIPEIFKISLPS